jgi:N-acetylglutamate synthase-like GNAT family acetyltransferase
MSKTGKKTSKSAKLEPAQANIHIRPAQPQDKNVVCQLARQFHAESLFAELPFSEAKVGLQFDHSLKADSPSISLVATDQDEVVGALNCILGQYLASETALIASIHAIYIRPDKRGGAAAVPLVQSVCQWAKANGAVYTMVHVTSGIQPSKTDAFFRKLGMTTLGGNYALKL